VPDVLLEKNASTPDALSHRPADASTTFPETGNQKPKTGPSPKDRFAGYFKFPGDFPPGYLDAVTGGYWPDNPPEHIPDRRWEDDFGSTSRFGNIKGTY
jgi:hypothetical protein